LLTADLEFIRIELLLNGESTLGLLFFRDFRFERRYAFDPCGPSSGIWPIGKSEMQRLRLFSPSMDELLETEHAPACGLIQT
jgi:hypothetical protein